MSEHVREGVEQLIATPQEHLGEFIDFCVDASLSPAFTLGSYVTELDARSVSADRQVADRAVERMLGLVPLMREVEADVRQVFGSKSSNQPFSMQYERTRLTLDGEYEIPLADAYDLVTYVNTAEVREVLDHHEVVERNGDPKRLLTGYAQPPRSHTADIESAWVAPGIKEFLNIAQTRYLADEQYVTPAETVSDMARTIDASMLVPLIVELEDACPKHFLGDESWHMPILEPQEAREERFMHRIIWGVFPVEQVRETVADLCSNDQTHFAKGFDEAVFEELMVRFAATADAASLEREIEHRKDLFHHTIRKAETVR